MVEVVMPLTDEQRRLTLPKWRRPLAPGWKYIRLPGTPTQQERRQAAVSYYYQTGDPGPAGDMGINYPDQRRTKKAIAFAKQYVNKLGRRG